MQGGKPLSHMSPAFLLEVAQGGMGFKALIWQPIWVMVVLAQYCFAGSDPSVVNQNEEHSYYLNFLFLLLY